MIAKVVKMQKGMEEMTNEELLVLYQESRDQGIKQELTLRYLYLAKSVAIQMNNLYSDFMQMEDIIHEGVIAIMKGIDRYNPERDSKFETFISRRIRGTVIDLIRKITGYQEIITRTVSPLKMQGSICMKSRGIYLPMKR